MRLRTRALTVSLTAALTSAAAVLTLAPAQAAPGGPGGPGGPKDGDVVVIAHRGSSAAAPENTLAAARQALRERADEIENDIQRTADGVLVLMHDATLVRTTDAEEVFPDRAPWTVGDFTLAELKRLDAGSWFSPRYAGEKVPTLAEWSRVVGQRSRMLLEVKNPGSYPGIEADLDRALRTDPHLRTAERRDRLVVQSFDVAWMRAFEQVDPDVAKGLLYGRTPTAADIAAARPWAEWINPSFRVITEADVDAIHAAGLRTGVYTVNQEADMRRLVAWDVDAIITDVPPVLQRVLREAR